MEGGCPGSRPRKQHGAIIMVYVILALIAALLFLFGYYVGNQIGRTEHVRRHLRQVREARRAVGLGIHGW